MQKTSVFSDFYCLRDKLALIGCTPFQRYCYMGKETAAKSKNRFLWSERIRGIFIFGSCTPHGKPGQVRRTLIE
jgi:hypothetical protein